MRKICQKCVYGRGSTPNHTGGAYSAPQLDLRDLLLRGGDGQYGREGKRKEKERGRGEEGREGKGHADTSFSPLRALPIWYHFLLCIIKPHKSDGHTASSVTDVLRLQSPSYKNSLPVQLGQTDIGYELFK